MELQAATDAVYVSGETTAREHSRSQRRCRSLPIFSSILRVQRWNLVFEKLVHEHSVVEIYADRLREFCEREHLPQEFYPHQRQPIPCNLRDFVEGVRLKDKAKPTTAVCTSTLELGIRHRRRERLRCGSIGSAVQCCRPPTADSGAQDGAKGSLLSYRQ